MLTGADRKFVDANQAACELFGCAKEALIGQESARFVAPGFDVVAARQTLDTQGRLRTDVPLQRADGTRIEVEIKVEAFGG